MNTVSPARTCRSSPATSISPSPSTMKNISVSSWEWGVDVVPGLTTTHAVPKAGSGRSGHGKSRFPQTLYASSNTRSSSVQLVTCITHLPVPALPHVRGKAVPIRARTAVTVAVSPAHFSKHRACHAGRQHGKPGDSHHGFGEPSRWGFPQYYRDVVRTLVKVSRQS